MLVTLPLVVLSRILPAQDPARKFFGLDENTEYPSLCLRYLVRGFGGGDGTQARASSARQQLTEH